MKFKLVMALAAAAMLGGCLHDNNTISNRPYSIGVYTQVDGVSSVLVGFKAGESGRVVGLNLKSSNSPNDYELLTDVDQKSGDKWEVFITQVPDHYLCNGDQMRGVINNNVRIRVSCKLPTVSTFAGSSTGEAGSVSGTDVESARFNAPGAMAVKSAEEILVVDSKNNKIRLITLNTGIVSDFATVENPVAITVTSTGPVFAAGTVLVLTKTHLIPFSSQGIRLVLNQAVPFPSAAGIAVNSEGVIFVSDSIDHVIWKIDILKNEKTVYAGQQEESGLVDATGSKARFFMPSGLVLDGDGNLYVADTGNSAIRKITPDGTVSTLSGPTGAQAGQTGFISGPASTARFTYPQALAIDDRRNLWVADSTNNAIRLVTTGGSGSTMAGLGSSNFGLVDGSPGVAKFNNPTGIVADATGNLYVADTTNNVIRKITFAVPD